MTVGSKSCDVRELRSPARLGLHGRSDVKLLRHAVTVEGENEGKPHSLDGFGRHRRAIGELKAWATVR